MSEQERSDERVILSEVKGNSIISASAQEFNKPKEMEQKSKEFWREKRKRRKEKQKQNGTFKKERVRLTEDFQFYKPNIVIDLGYENLLTFKV